MTQRTQALRGRITIQMMAVAEQEGLLAEEVRRGVAWLKGRYASRLTQFTKAFVPKELDGVSEPK